jgi:hypothetical protein
MEIFLHRDRKTEVISLDEGATPAAVVKQFEEVDDLFVFVEGGDVALSDDLALIEQQVADGAHVTVGKHHKVEVTVGFNGARRAHKFPPSRRVERAFDWACREFRLAATDKAEHTLAIGDEPVDLRLLIGGFADKHGRAHFELVSRHRFEG